MSDSRADKLEIRLLGNPSFRLNGQPLANLASKKAEALLAYLAHTQRLHTRESLATLLWGDRPQAQAMGNLRVVLSSLRKQLASFLTITRQTAAINLKSNYWLDTIEFTRHVTPILQELSHTDTLSDTQANRLETALALYHADFLTGFFIKNSLSFEEWVSLEREYLNRHATEGLEALVEHALRQGGYPHGLELATRLLKLSPLHEKAHRYMMRLLALNGQRSAAQQQYETCAAILEAELGVTPHPQTTALYDRIRTIEALPPPNLPQQTTPFVGRKDELAAIGKQLMTPACRLLTLVGPGGIGKTRLAIQLAEQKKRAFLHGAHYLSLIPFHDVDAVTHALLNSLNIQVDSADTTAHLLDYLREKELLLLLDNAEHLPAVGTLVSRIIDYAPLVKVLVTSQERLRLQPEWLFEVRGLGYPPTGHLPADSLPDSEAVELFLQRAKAIYPTFSPTPADVQAIVRICQLLHGMPLGLELAASWTRLLSCPDIATEIETNLDFLTSFVQGSPDRHASLRAVFNQAWQLLSKKERAIVGMLTVFRDPFKVRAAQAVAQTDLQTLMSLIDKSFLQRDRHGYIAIHPLLKQFARQTIHKGSTEYQSAHQRFSQFYADFLENQTPRLKGAQQKQAEAEIGVEVENVRAAWEWVIAHRRTALIEQMLESSYLFLWSRGWWHEGETLFRAAIAAASDSTPDADDSMLVARLRMALAEFFAWQSKYDAAREVLAQCRRVFENRQAWREMTIALDMDGRIDYWHGNFAAAQRMFEQAVDVARQANADYELAQALNSLATSLCDASADYDRAGVLYEESLAISRRLGDHYGIAKVIINQGSIELERQNLAQAKRLFEESLEIYQDIDYRHGISAALTYLGKTTVRQGDLETAQRYLQKSLDMNRQSGDRRAFVSNLKTTANLHIQMGQLHKAKRFARQALREAIALDVHHSVMDMLLVWAKISEAEGMSESAYCLLCCLLQQAEIGQELKSRIETEHARLTNHLSPEALERCSRQVETVTMSSCITNILAD